MGPVPSTSQMGADGTKRVLRPLRRCPTGPGGVTMKLTRTVTCALQATLQLAEEKTSQPVPCSRLAAEGKMPERFLLQILRSLVKHGILRSTRGVEGGYALVRRAEDVSVLNVIEAIDGPLNAHLPISEGLSTSPQDRLRHALLQVNESARRSLESIKLSQLMQPADQ